jgi:hypothetical protein
MMIKNDKERITMANRAKYHIVVKGRLDDRWAKWFNGTTRKDEQDRHGMPCTRLTCSVRDQSELIGILNRLSNLNLPLLEVKWMTPEEHKKE